MKSKLASAKDGERTFVLILDASEDAFATIAEGDDSKPRSHLHVVRGLCDGSARGGHLLKETARPTIEVMVAEAPTRPRREKQPDLGIALISVS